MPNNAPKTREAIEAAVHTNREKDDKRYHLGASVIGGTCQREIWYKWRWAYPDAKIFDARMLQLFNRGHLEESRFIKLLRDAGVTVYAAGESGELKAQMRISDIDGHFGGTPDGVGVGIPDLPADEAVLLEFKTFNDHQFQELKKNGVITAKWEYFVQVQIYLEKLGLARCLFMAVNKNDDELYLEIISANAPEAQKYIDRARVIIYADTPPQRISESPAWWECKFCDFSKICHFEDFPGINCRTCAFSAVTPEGWTCSRGNAGIEGQLGCAQHLFDPRFFPSWQVLAFTDNPQPVFQIWNGTEEFFHGNKPGSIQYSSAWLLEHGLAPF